MLCKTPRDLPSLGRMLEWPEVRSLRRQYGEFLVKHALRDSLEVARQSLLDGREVEAAGIVREAERMLQPAQRRVLNLTGTVLHTNLGRAPLGGLLTAVAERLTGYSVLEYDLESGRRGRRGEAVERMLCWLIGCESALMVNNCASAMLLLLTTLAKGREVVVSRGELVEIGGSFRIPDILALSGAVLVEVGTTNRTRICDYENAITENTGLLLSTHRSNFRIVGFTESPEPAELVELGRRYSLPVAYDLGSGMLTRIVEGEPSVVDAAGYSLTAFSGDKLLGGPQCGVIAGQRELVDRCRKHPFYRALRCDKLTLALMEEALRRHAVNPREVPTVELLTAEVEALRGRAESLCDSLSPLLPKGCRVETVPTVAQVGGGSLPGGELPSVALVLSFSESGEESRMQARLRRGDPPVIARVEKGQVVLDLRSLPAEEDDEFLAALRRIFT